MPTIGEVYNPLIEAAKNNSPSAFELLTELGRAIYEANPGKCTSVEDGVEAAKKNLDYYCQYFDEETARLVKQFYSLGSGFRGLNGNKYAFK
jgi:hypothetical protein